MGTSFLSYSRVDKNFASKFAEDLSKNGIDVWFDKTHILTGSLWDEEIEKALKKCTTIIVILSSNSIKSKNVLDEISFAVDENKRIIPVKISDCDIPIRIRRFQYIDVSNDYATGLKLVLDSFNKSNLSPPKVNSKKYRFFSNKALFIGALTSTFLIIVSIYLSLRKSEKKTPQIITSDTSATPKLEKPILVKAINYDDKKFIFSETQAKGIKIVAMYPLQNDAYPDYSASNYKRELGYHRYIEFKNNSAFVDGKSVNFNFNNHIIGTTELPYTIFDLNNFSISLNLKTDLNNKAMPILYIGENCRQFGIEISISNLIFITLNNTTITIPTFKKIESNTWNEIIFIYTNKTVLLYLNRELISRYKYELNECPIKFEKDGIHIVSANNANGTAFNGYWKDFNIYTLLF